MVEAEMVVMTALVIKLELRVLVGGVAVTLGWMEVDLEVELDGGSAMVTLLQDLQHIRWKSGREQ